MLILLYILKYYTQNSQKLVHRRLGYFLSITFCNFYSLLPAYFFLLPCSFGLPSSFPYLPISYHFVCDEFKVTISHSHHLFLTNSLLILICSSLWCKITQSFKSHCYVHCESKSGIWKILWEVIKVHLRYNIEKEIYFLSKTCLKGQLISKCLFGVFNFLQKTNKNKSHSSKIEFLCSFFGGNVGLKKLFQLCLTFTTQPPGLKKISAD